MKTIFSLLLIALLSSNESIATPKPFQAIAGDSMTIQTRQIRKAHRILLYPDASETILFFNVRGADGKVYQLYMFDMHGKMVRQAETRNKQTTLIKNIEKGTYLFEVFSDDDKIGTGYVAVK